MNDTTYEDARDASDRVLTPDGPDGPHVICYSNLLDARRASAYQAEFERDYGDQTIIMCNDDPIPWAAERAAIMFENGAAAAQVSPAEQVARGIEKSRRATRVDPVEAHRRRLQMPGERRFLDWLAACPIPEIAKVARDLRNK